LEFHGDTVISFTCSQFVHRGLLKSEVGVEEKKLELEKTREELGTQETVVKKIKKRRLLWFGHVERMEGKRSRGRQRKIWMDNVREEMREKHINMTRIGEAISNREVWRSLVRASLSAL